MTKDDLKQYQILMLEIKQLEAEKNRLSDLTLSAGIISDMPKAKGIKVDPTGEIATRLGDLATLMANKMNTAISLRISIEEAIDSLEPMERVLMRGRYIEGKTWEKIALEVNYSYRNIIRIHRSILQKLSYHVL